MLNNHEISDEGHFHESDSRLKFCDCEAKMLHFLGDFPPTPLQPPNFHQFQEVSIQGLHLEILTAIIGEYHIMRIGSERT